MYHLAELLKFKTTQDGTELIVKIPDVDLTTLFGGKVSKNCTLWIDDGRTITPEQRRKAWATINDIAIWQGDSAKYLHEILKNEFILDNKEGSFSLSDCSVRVARDYISYILGFALENGIQLAEPGIKRTDDIGKYLYMCIKHKKCAICGIKGERHHVDTIGMGNDRRRVDDSDKRILCLCRTHHTEAHKSGVVDFEKKYKVYGIIVKDFDINS